MRPPPPEVVTEAGQGPRGIPGATLVSLLLAIAIIWIASTRLSRPVARPLSRQVSTAVDSGDSLVWPDMRIDLNSATAAELALLPGIGPGLSERIVTDREANGPFQSIEDVTRVRMIGPSHVLRISPLAIAEPPVPQTPGS